MTKSDGIASDPLPEQAATSSQDESAHREGAESSKTPRFTTRFWIWLMSTRPQIPINGSAAVMFIHSMQTTASARFAASVRLRHKSKAYFFTSTIFSLGLILISLLQLANVNLRFDSQVLTAMTAFLAVAVLVYSVTAGTAHYEVRAEQLNECGDRIKNLVRAIKREHEFHSCQLPEDKLADYENKYHLIVTDTEPHSRNDYRRTLLDMEGEYRMTGLIRATELTKYYGSRFMELIPHIALLSLEVVFLMDMLGYTTLLQPLHPR